MATRKTEVLHLENNGHNVIIVLYSDPNTYAVVVDGNELNGSYPNIDSAVQFAATYTNNN